MTQKKRENFQLATQSEALAEKVATLEMECGVIKDENRVYKEVLATLKAKLDTEIEALKRENRAYKELAEVDARLEDKLGSSAKQFSISDD